MVQKIVIFITTLEKEQYTIFNRHFGISADGASASGPSFVDANNYGGSQYSLFYGGPSADRSFDAAGRVTMNNLLPTTTSIELPQQCTCCGRIFGTLTMDSRG
jgi:hypothetical protein